MPYDEGMPKRSSKPKRKRAARIASSNPGVDLTDFEKALKAIEELENLGIRPREYNLRAPTDSYHPTHAGRDNQQDLDLT